MHYYLYYHLKSFFLLSISHVLYFNLSFLSSVRSISRCMQARAYLHLYVVYLKNDSMSKNSSSQFWNRRTRIFIIRVANFEMCAFQIFFVKIWVANVNCKKIYRCPIWATVTTLGYYRGSTFCVKNIYIDRWNETETKQVETKQNKKNEIRTVDVAPVFSNLYIT